MPEPLPVAAARTTSTEELRLEELRQLHVLDTPPDSDFDALLRLASELSGVPQGAITFVDEHRVFHKASLGLEIGDVPRKVAFCDHTIRKAELLVVEDTEQDIRFRNNPAATAAGIRFYVGAPLTMPSGHRLGALCLFDRKPQTLSGQQADMIDSIARQVVTLLKLRSERARSERIAEQIAREQALFRVYFDHSPVQSCLKDAEGRILLYNQAFAKRFGIDPTQWVGKKTNELWPQEIADQVEDLEIQARMTKTPVTRYINVQENGRTCSWRTTRIHCRNHEGHDLRLSISVEMTREVEEKRQIETTNNLLRRANSQLADLCRRDEVTGLLDKSNFERLCLEAFNCLQEAGTPFGIVRVEVNCKSNTHANALYKEIATAIAAETSTFQIAARIAAGNFRLLIKHLDTQQSDNITERIRKCLQPIEAKFRLKIRVGEEVFTDAGQNMNKFLERLNCNLPELGAGREQRLLSAGSEALLRDTAELEQGWQHLV